MTTLRRHWTAVLLAVPRNVWQAALAYGAAAWVVLQVVDVLGETWGWSSAALQALQIVMMGGLVATVLMAWFNRERARGGARLLEVALVLLVVGGAVAAAAWRATAADAAGGLSAAEPGGLPSVAILPFAYDGDREADRVFATGMQEQIASRLAAVPGLRVVRGSAPAEARAGVGDVEAAPRTDWLLTGRLTREGSRAVTHVRLSRPSGGRPLWSRTWKDDLTTEHLLEVQRVVALEVAASVRGRLSAEEADGLEVAGVADLEAYRSYLRGSALFDDRYDRASMMGAIEAFEAALSREPDFAAALASLVHAWSWMSWQFQEAGARPAAQAYLDRLYTLDAGRVETHLAAAYYHYYATRDFDSALRELRVVVRGRPGDTWAWAVKGYVERRLGMWESSIDSQLRAAELDPRAAQVAYNLGRTLHRLGRYGEAEGYLRRALHLEPHRSLYVRALMSLQQARGDTAGMRAALEDGRRAGGAAGLADEEPRMLSLAGHHREALAAWDAVRGEERAGPWHRTAGLLAWMAGDSARMRLHGDSLRRVAEAELEEAREAVGGARPNVVLGELALAHALLGGGEEARRYGELSVDPLTTTRDAYDGSGDLYRLAVTYTVAGDAEAALALLGRILEGPSAYSRAAFDLLPELATLRDHPGWEGLPEGYGPLR